MKWPKLAEKTLIEKGFRAIESGVYASRFRDNYYLLVMKGGGGEIAKLYAAVWTPGMIVEGNELDLKAIYNLPVGGAVSLNSVGSDAGETYWMDDEIADEASFGSQLIDLIDEIAIPWFCAFQGRKDLSDAITINELSIEIELDERAECAGDELGIRLESDGIHCGDKYERYSNKAFLEGPVDTLAKALHECGFVLNISNGVRFYRHRRDANLYDIIYPRLIAFGARIIFDLFVWVPEFELAHHVDELPEDLLIVNGGVLSDSGIQAYPFLNERCSIPFGSKWINSVTNRINSIAIPWYDSIDDRQALLSSVREDYRPLLGRSFAGSKSLSQMIMGQI